MTKNKVAVVTGGGAGLGKAIACQLADDGYAVVIADLNIDNAKKTAEQIKQNHHEAVAVAGDVSKQDDHVRFVQTAVDHFGRLDTYVNNAGIVHVEALQKETPASLNQIYSINVFGTIYGMQAAVAQFEKQDDGDHLRKIINASSIAGHTGSPLPLLSAYSSTKFAVRGLTQAVAKEVGKSKITVNAYCPGLIATDMGELIDQKMMAELGGHKGEFLKNYDDSITLDKVGKPEDIAHLVSFLASPQSDFITGQAIITDGGGIMV